MPRQVRWCESTTPLVLVLAGWTAAAGASAPESVTHTLISDRVDGVHTDLDADIAPVQFGPLIIRLTSSSHTLEVMEHELRLAAVDAEVDAATLKARYRGEARLVAELEVGGVTSEIEDHVVVPLQETEVAGRIEIAREGEGYRLTAVEAPSHVEIQVESDLAGRMELLCRGFAVMSLGGIDCTALDEALSTVRLPLPEPGSSYFVSAADLTHEERRQLDTYLQQRW